jgi:hypothetical protein
MPPFWSIKDARGTTRRVAFTRAAAWHAVPHSLKLRFALWAAGMTAYTAAGLWWLQLLRRPGRPLPVPALVVIGIYALVSLIGIEALIRQIRAFAHRAAAQQLALRRCPTCNYPLDAIEPDEKNLRTCPECAATWELPVSVPEEQT